jgi:DNA (cytosine-5)-methyltransferase 1
MYNFIEVCSGAGGLSLGFINKNFQPIILNDTDKYCIDTLKKNHKEKSENKSENKSTQVRIEHKSFTEIDFTPYKRKIDVFMGGVPCQAFSQAGKRKGLFDCRGNLILEFVKKISEIEPKVFMIENVKGLLTHDKGCTFRKIIEILEDSGNYKVYHKVLNANDYGVAQKRERLFIVGIRKNLPKHKDFKFPIPHENKPKLGDIINIPYEGKDNTVFDGYKYSEKKYEIMKLIPEGGCWINLPLDLQKEYLKKSFTSGGGKRGIARRLSMDKPCLTLTTSPSQKQTERCHPLETRPLNILEYRRIQSFPDSYIITGSLIQRYKQIGNAVPVKLAESMAESIKDILD